MIKHNGNQVKKEIEKSFKDIKSFVDDEKQKIILTALTDLMTLSPVDSGTYRASHVLSAGMPSNEIKERKGGVAAGGIDFASFQEAESKIRNLKDRFVFIVNNLKYAEKVEYGDAKRIPHAVYATAEQRAENNIQNLKNKIDDLKNK